jgi:ABC-type cobalamin transport system permease subunit
MDRDWRCRKYGPLMWMETLIKLLAVGVGIASLSIYDNTDYGYNGTRLAQCIIMAIVGAGIIALTAQRVLDKELFALGFIILVLVGHWIMTLITFLSKDPASFLFVYVFLMILGEYVRMMYIFLEENLDMRFLNKPILMGISGVFIVLYIVVMIIQVVKWLVEYET